MAELRIFAVGLNLPPVEGLEHLPLVSSQSFLDADIVVLRPSLSGFRSEGYFQGVPSLDENASFQAQNALSGWWTRVRAAQNAGKTIVFLLPPKEDVFVDTGEKTFSGTGRNRQTTRHVAPFDNYRFLPLSKANPVFSSGTEIIQTRDLGPLATLYSFYKGRLKYNCYFNADDMKCLLSTKAGRHCVGASTSPSMFLLPDIDVGPDEIWAYSQSGNPKYENGKRVPTKEAEEAAFGFRDQIFALHRAISRGAELTPEPEWASAHLFRLPTESTLESDILEVNSQLEALNERKALLEKQRVEAGDLRNLLFETGEPLEDSVRKALTILGFSATPFENAQSEFDVVFESAEGRFIGEVEGRDSRAINVAKISQLRRNVDEDFARDEIDAPSIGVLFGNGFRLDDPSSRDECFTTKVISAAPTLSIVLVRTPDLFRAVQTFLENGDMEFARQCRLAIADSTGEIVRFPIVDRPAVADQSLAPDGHVGAPVPEEGTDG